MKENPSTTIYHTNDKYKDNSNHYELKDLMIAKLTGENELLNRQFSQFKDEKVNLSSMPVQAQTLLTMQRERIDYLEAEYAKLYKAS